MGFADVTDSRRQLGASIADEESWGIPNRRLSPEIVAGDGALPSLDPSAELRRRRLTSSNDTTLVTFDIIYDLLMTNYSTSGKLYQAVEADVASAVDSGGLVTAIDRIASAAGNSLLTSASLVASAAESTFTTTDADAVTFAPTALYDYCPPLYMSPNQLAVYMVDVLCFDKNTERRIPGDMCAYLRVLRTETFSSPRCALKEDPTTIIPSSVPTPKPSSETTVYESCWDAPSTDGIYTIYPDGESGTSYEVYCDQTTDSGGWMLIWAYRHEGGENYDLVSGTIPTNATHGYSHVHINDFDGWTEDDITAVRFYCHGELTGRTIHFYTENSFVTDVAYDGDSSSNAVSYWTSGYTTLSGHDAYLPGAADYVLTSSSDGFYYFPFYTSGTYHWGIKAGSRWECDDYSGGYSYSTLHQVWVRVGSESR